MGDLDGDDILDMAIAIYGPHYNGRMVQLYRGLGDGTFEVWAADGYDEVNDIQGINRDGVDDGVILTQGKNPISTLIGDFNGDGVNDVIVSTNNGGWKLDVMIQDPSGGFTLVDSDRAGQNPHFLAQADFNEDGFMDVVAGSWMLSRVHGSRGSTCS